MFGYWVENSLFREKIKRQNAMDVLKKELNHSRHKIKKVSKLDEKLVTVQRKAAPLHAAPFSGRFIHLTVDIKRLAKRMTPSLFRTSAIRCLLSGTTIFSL